MASDSGYTGTIQDGSADFDNVGDAQSAAFGILNSDDAVAALDDMSDKLAAAVAGGLSVRGAFQPPVINSGNANSVGATVGQAYAAISKARDAIANQVSFNDQMADAAGKTAIALNYLTAGKVTLDFAQKQFFNDVWDGFKALVPELPDTDWLKWAFFIALVGGVGIVAYKVAK